MAMRAIQISTDIFAAIWKMQEPGENSEDEILRRALKLPPQKEASVPRRDLAMAEGFVDRRYNLVLEPGFMIFRTYKGTDYRAQALQGSWWLNGKGYVTLNEVSKAIGITHENAWANWFYKDDQGKRRPLDSMRDQSKVVRRPKEVVTLADLDLE
jgi:hypothetical protein